MKRTLNIPVWHESRGCQALLVGAVLSGVLLLPGAQGLADEFDDAGKPAAGMPAGDKPADGGKDAAPAKDDSARAIAAIIKNPIEDPLVRTLLQSNPQTPSELVRAMKVLLDIRRAPVAKLLVKALLDTQPAPQELDRLLEEFGSATFIGLAATPEFGPEMGKFVANLFEQAQTFRENPERLDKMIRALRSPQIRTRHEAVAQLSRTHTAAVLALLRALADSQRADEHAAVRQMLVDMGTDAVGPVTGALRTSDPALRAQVIQILGRLASRQALFNLLRPAVDPAMEPDVRQAAQHALEAILGSIPTLSEAQSALEQEVTRRLGYAVAHSGETQPTTEVWDWDAAQNASVLRTPAVSVAAVDQAAVLARDLLALRPNHSPTRELCLTALLTAARLDQDLDAQLPTGPGTAHDIAAEQGADALDDVLAGALAARNYAAAQAAAEILGEIGKPTLLTRFTQRPSPLASAAMSGDRRVRFAALDAALKLAPNIRYAGSSAIADDLAYFAGTSGVPRVLVGHPRSEAAQLLAGYLAELGYETDIATNGRSLLAQSITSADYDFILVHFNLPGMQIDDILAGLRRDGRTERLPVGILAAEDRLRWAERLAGGVPLTDAFLEPVASTTMKFRADHLLALVGRHQVPFERRQAWAATALDQIDRLAATRKGNIYDLQPVVPAVTRAMAVPALGASALRALANLGTVAGQQALLETANRGTQSIESRQRAADEFRRSVQRYGILLTAPEISRQYSLYNASELLKPEVQQVYASILDTLEQRGRAAETR